MISLSNRHICFIVPNKVLLHFHDIESALLSEHIRGQRVARSFAMSASVPAGTKRRTVYDGRNSDQVPGTFARGEGDVPSPDQTVNEAYDSTGDTYDFYFQVFKRNSVDGRGMRLDSTVHHGKHFCNAFWDGHQMIFGDGDGKTYVGFANALDIVAHELTHGVTHFTVPGGLTQGDQSGALNESISDVFGSMAKQWNKKQDVTQADWLIGAWVLTPAAGKALRSMQDPGNKSITWEGDEQPKDMSGYVPGGESHINSGIPNHAFYLAAMKLGGHSWEKVGPIWYRALSLLSSQASFQEAAQATIHAVTLLGYGDAEREAVTSAWQAVKVIT